MTESTERLPITVVIPALNESARIRGAIDSVSWAAEVIVADGGSTDETVATARACGARTIEVRDVTIGAQRNAAIATSAHEWILALDADERATSALRDQLRAMLAAPSHDVYRVRRENVYLGRVMRHGRFGRDWHICVFRRDMRYNDARVHEHLNGVRDAGRLPGPIVHTPYRDLAHHAAKIARYAEWAADDRAGRAAGPSAASIVVKPPLRFLRDYAVYGGWRDGWRGAVAAMMSAHSVFMRAAALRARRDAAP